MARLTKDTNPYAYFMIMAFILFWLATCILLLQELNYITWDFHIVLTEEKNKNKLCGQNLKYGIEMTVMKKLSELVAIRSWNWIFLKQLKVFGYTSLFLKPQSITLHHFSTIAYLQLDSEVYAVNVKLLFQSWTGFDIKQLWLEHHREQARLCRTEQKKTRFCQCCNDVLLLPFQLD